MDLSTAVDTLGSSASLDTPATDAFVTPASTKAGPVTAFFGSKLSTFAANEAALSSFQSPLAVKGVPASTTSPSSSYFKGARTTESPNNPRLLLLIRYIRPSLTMV